jgi:hypothetical protein
MAPMNNTKQRNNEKKSIEKSQKILRPAYYQPYVSDTGVFFESFQIGETCTN